MCLVSNALDLSCQVRLVRGPSVSEHVEKEGEGALLGGSGVLHGGLAHLTKGPCLQVFFPPRVHFQVVVDALMLEKEGLVAPERGRDLARRHYAPNQVAARARKFVEWAGVGEHLPQHSSRGYGTELI